MATFGFEPKHFSTSLEEVEDGKQLWLLRLPKKFSLDKLPKKIKLDLKAVAKDGEHVSTHLGSIGDKSYDLTSGSAAELSQFYTVLGEGDDLEFAPQFTRQFSVVEQLAIPTLEPQSFTKPTIPPFQGTLTLQGTPSGYGTTPVKTGSAAAKASSKGQKKKRAATNTAKPSAVSTKRSIEDTDDASLPVGKKTKLSPGSASKSKKDTKKSKKKAKKKKTKKKKKASKDSNSD